MPNGRPCSVEGAQAVDRNWTQIPVYSTIDPSARFDATSAYDGRDGYLLVFGGRTVNSIEGDTWSFAADSWTSRSPFIVNSTNSPSPRFGSAMAFDPALGAVFLFGGKDLSTLWGDTWEYRGGSWSLLPSATSPSARAYATLAFFPQLAALILFGGNSAIGPENDTWEFNQSGWHNITAAVGPSPAARYGCGVANDSVDKLLVIFGGYNPAAGFLSDTWSFNGVAWVRIAALTSPGPREDPQMTFDPLRQSVLLYGGISNGGGRWGDLWRFVSGVWSLQSASENATLAARDGGVMAPVPSSHLPYSEVVMFGGSENALLPVNETWLYGSPLPLGLSAPASPRLVYDQGLPIPMDVFAVGGTQPYTYTWFGLPAGCPPATDNVSWLVCTPSSTVRASSEFSVHAQVSDPSGDVAAGGGTTFVVNPVPEIVTFVANPSTVVIGSTVTLSVGVSGGSGWLVFIYRGTPSGCPSHNSSKLICAPNETGVFTVSVQVIDSLGVNASQTTLFLVTRATGSGTLPTITLIESLAVGAGVAVAASAVAVYWWRRSRTSRGSGADGGSARKTG